MQKRNYIPLSLVRILLLFLIAGFIFLCQFQCSVKEKEESVQAYAALSDTVGYVGMQTCRQCHASIYDTYIQTGMGKSFDVATVSKSAAQSNFGTAVYDAHRDMSYEMMTIGDSLFLSEFRMRGKDTVYKRIEHVNYIVGSGQHTNSHIMNTGGYLTQMPITYYCQKEKWDLPPGYEEGGNTRFDRRVGLECMSCHNAYPEFVKGSENKFVHLPGGIDCERCHGPGEVHVHNMQSGKLVDIGKEIDYSIVNPSKLPIDLQFDVCQRCHIQGNAVLKEGKSFFDFRPGMPLSDVMDVYMPVYSGSESEHIMASHAERLKMSRCFIATHERSSDEEQNLRPYKNSLTCVTCHDPHVSSTIAGDAHFNSVCSSCHSTDKKNFCTEEQAALEIADMNCISCHMPGNNTLDIPHVTVHDHMIKIPLTEEDELAIREFLGIKAINNPRPDSHSKGQAFIAYYERFGFAEHVLDSAEKYFFKDQPGDIHALIHIAYLRSDYDKVISLAKATDGMLQSLKHQSYDNRDAWTAYRIGESFFNRGMNAEALEFFSKAHSLAPFDMNFANKFGVTLMQTAQFEAAERVFRYMISEYPKMPEPWTNLGFLLLKHSADTAEAAACYRRALALDPDNKAGMLNLIGLHMYKSDFHRAEKLLENYLLKYPDDNQALNLLSGLKDIK